MDESPFSALVELCSARYQEIFAEREEFGPTDPLEFHLYHLACYWGRLVGFCAHAPESFVQSIESDLGAYIQVASNHAARLITEDSPAEDIWQEYLTRTRAMLYERPVKFGAVQAASKQFDRVLVALNYDPRAKR